MNFADKVKTYRMRRNLTQEDLSSMCGITRRSIINYETAGHIPSVKITRKIATALGVSTYFLTHDECDDPDAFIEEEPYILAARDAFGKAGAEQLAAALKNDTAMLAGGILSEEQKDMFYEAITKAYFMNKANAKIKFGQPKKQSY